MYKPLKCTFGLQYEMPYDGYILRHDSNEIYPLYANKFLHKYALNSFDTSKQYAYKLAAFFNYLERYYQINYQEAELFHFKKYLTYLSYYTDEPLSYNISESKISLHTLSEHFSVIKSFYVYLRSQNIELSIPFVNKGSNNYHSYLYGQIWEDTTLTVLIDRLEGRSKSPRDYEKWYDDKEKVCILNSFNTIRDKAVFALSLDGLRIGEILSLHKTDIKSDGTVHPRKSKTLAKGNCERLAVLSEQSKQLIKEYLFNERDIIEIELLKKGIAIDDTLFINIKLRKNDVGKALKYHNYLEILKRAAKNAGMHPQKIRTHSGRSTMAGELFRAQAKNPESITDNQINDLMGWKSTDSAEPYKNRLDKEIAYETFKHLDSQRKVRKNDADNTNKD
jgi:integrase/recombinase XerD